MRLLTFSTLFPNAELPNQAVFVETRLRKLVASGKVESQVVAPIPWFPFKHHRFGRYAAFAKTPPEELRFGLKVAHPRYPLLPKVGMTIAPFLLANAVKPAVRKIIDDGYDFDLIDAHYFYPDGVAAVMLGRYFNKPVVVTARGTDITLIPQYRLPRKMILWAARHSKGVITVCNALKTEMVRLGVAADRIVPLRNGVDLQLFRPVDRVSIRKELGINQFTLLSAGNLVPVKGHDLVIKALSMLPDVRLLIAGSGPEGKGLEDLVKRLNVADRVRFLGALPQAVLSKYYGAVDALVLASSREGWANVLLESMACGTPVIASRVWGTPEVVASGEAGVLMGERTPEGIVEAIHVLRTQYPRHEATRKYAEQFSWDETTAGQVQLFQQILAKGSM
jgi:teichuronic acid biosynthesis glycosyltransferase TuaC